MDTQFGFCDVHEFNWKKLWFYLVWVNTSTQVYQKDGQFYGTTKKGKFMTEADAQKEGYHAAKSSASGKKAASDTKK